jgi:hypothetical protein
VYNDEMEQGGGKNRMTNCYYMKEKGLWKVLQRNNNNKILKHRKDKYVYAVIRPNFVVGMPDMEHLGCKIQWYFEIIPKKKKENTEPKQVQPKPQPTTTLQNKRGSISYTMR